MIFDGIDIVPLTTFSPLLLNVGNNLSGLCSVDLIPFQSGVFNHQGKYKEWGNMIKGILENVFLCS